MKLAKDYIIFPLDVPNVEDAHKNIRLLADDVGMFKVGLELFIQAGPEIIRFIQDHAAAQIFLDLKLHDIPATVGRAMSRVADLGVSFATVHCGESIKMLEAAVSGAQGKVGVLGVTVLTSVSAQDIQSAGFSDDLSALVMKRADMAKHAGCAGIVCSGLEAAQIKTQFGKDFAAITPGIRPAWELTSDDQQRVTTPAQAIQNGSDYIVIGRPIRDAKNPKEAAQRVAHEISQVI